MPKFVNLAAAEKWARITYGCSRDEALRLNAAPLKRIGSFAHAYRVQRRAARARGIAWEFTLPTWVAVWISSGKWELRGRGIGHFCMSRYGDVGPYSAGNVLIQLCTQNSREGIEVARAAINAKAAHRVGAGRGWTYRPSMHGANPYQVMVRSRYVGCYATQEAAERAYAEAVDQIRHGQQSAGGAQ